MNEQKFNATPNIGSYKKEAEELLKRCPNLARIRKKRLFKIFFKTSIVCLAILGLTGYLYFSTHQVALAVVGVALAAYALYKTANPRKNLQRRYGRVEEIRFFQTRVVNKKGFMNSYTAMMDAVVLIVSLKAANGRRYKMELENRFQDVIKEGDVLIQLPGIPYFINKTPGDWVICPYCGNMMPRESEDCIGCGRENIYGRE